MSGSGWKGMSKMATEIIEEILCLREEWKDEWTRLGEVDNPLILCGGGCTSSFILEEFRNKGINPVCFCDNSKDKQGKKIDDLSILSVQDAMDQFQNGIYYITTQLYYTQIRDQLLYMGIPADRIIQYDLICQFEWEKNYLQFIDQHKKEISELIDSMADDKSKEVIFARLKFLVTRKRDYVCNVRGKVQYFETFIIEYENINAFIDVGLYTGDSVLEFEKYNSMHECIIYGFELDDELYNCAEKNLKHLENKVKLIKKGVSDKDGIQHINSMLGEMQSISGIFGESDASPDHTVETCRLDSVLDENMSNAFIKMDIEGAEMLALQGAESFISNNHPLLAICIYHKAEDIIEIPRIIKKYYDEYKFYVRHYSDNQTETVLYAVPETGN